MSLAALGRAQDEGDPTSLADAELAGLTVRQAQALAGLAAAIEQALG